MINIKLLHEFVAHWTGKGYEKGESQQFWMTLLRALGVENPDQFIEFEQQVKMDSTAFIDGFIPSTKVLIEQKSITKNLGDPIKQSDGSQLNPFQQAKRYASNLPLSKHPRWIVTCNFREFWVYDMEQPNAEPQKILFENLEKEHYRLRFLVDQGNENLQKEMELSIKAGDLVGRIYDLILPQYANPNDPETLRSLNQLCVRLVFCLFAEDAGLFGDKNEFHDYLAQYPAKDIRRALIDLFKVLDTKPEDRDPYLDDELKNFPYVNGGLFSNENIEIPQFTEELKNLILTKASADFDWSEISPTIFGAVFESTLNPETRRSGGMHYTSIENIHKVIDPLFLNQLGHELDACGDNKKSLQAFQDKLASLTFFDPACGSGNFLTETYVSLRRMENKVISKLQGPQMVMGDFKNPVKVSIHQFYGIEINDFAVSVATTALWIAELQMLRETERIASFKVDPLPLKTYHNIHEGNALRLDWSEIFPPSPLGEGRGEAFIMGNPPFVGYSLQTEDQKTDILSIMVDEKGKPYKMAGKVDYVAGWYYKTAEMMQANPSIRAALVSTNSITQGEQVAGIWKPLYERYNIHIDFAYPTFRWDSESSLKAHVHCVIIGFSIVPLVGNSIAAPRLYLPDGTYKPCTNINAYLVDGPNAFIDSISKPLCDVPKMVTGNRPADGGHLIIEGEDYADFIAKEPNALPYIKKLTGALEYINNKPRYCLWLKDITPAQLKALPLVYERVRLCKEDREQAPDPGRQKLAATPHLFREQNNPESYVIVPATSSENRRYIPLGFLGADTIPTNSAIIIPSATLYHFGVLTSNVHMSWMRAVCGRLEMRYRYSKDIVYNNFPWPTPTDEQKAKIEQTAQAILDARQKYLSPSPLGEGRGEASCSLADLYDEVAMPVELRKAHQENDKAVMAAYGFKVGMTESECVARLLEMYQELTR